MAEPTPSPQPQQPPPGYYPPYGAQPYPPPYVPQEPKLTHKQKIFLAIGLLLFLLFGLYSSCHQAVATNAAAHANNPVFPASPQSIESEREQAQRELDEAQRQAEAAKRRLQNAPTMPHETQTQTGNTGARENDPETQFWQQARIARWRREQDAPYASGVGFVTKRPETSTKGASAATAEVPPGSSYPSSPAQVPSPATDQRDAAEPTKQEGQPQQNPTAYDFDQAEGQLHRLMEGTILESTLMNQLDGEFVGPVICQISNNVWDLSGRNLLIPMGSKAIGTAHSVSSTSQRRLAVTFHRITMPDGFSLNLDQFQGLNQLGETGLVDKVNAHYAQILGASLAIGAISGLAELGQTGATYSPLTGFRAGLSQQGAESAMRVLDRFLNRQPTIKVLPGSRVKIILTTDLPGVPEYANHRMDPNL